jgi:hypothetical protein
MKLRQKISGGVRSGRGAKGLPGDPFGPLNRQEARMGYPRHLDRRSRSSALTTLRRLIRPRYLGSNEKWHV